MVRCLVAVFCGFLANPALANDFMPVRDRSEFLNLIQEKQLRVGLYNLTLHVTPDGKIHGQALGWGITGTWDWQDGYFCRKLDWSGYEIGPDCQLVEARQGKTLRFTAEKGTGKSASFRLR